MGVRTRSRSTPGDVRGPFVFKGVYNATGQVVNGPTNYWFNIVQNQTTSDEEHHWRGTSSDGDVGGDFVSTRQVYKGAITPVIRLRYVYVGSTYSYDGPIAIFGSGMYPPATGSGIAALQGLGATAISRTIPTNPAASAAQFLGELREGLPSVPGKELIGRKTSVSNAGAKAGGEHLNLQFGVLPIVNDVQKFAVAARDSKKILAQFERDSGRLIRRRYSFPSTVTTVVTDLGNTQMYPPFPAPAHNGGFQYPTTLTTTTTVDRWFSGAYTYYLNMGSTARDKMERHVQEANKLLGVRVTPELVWNLTPWTWAADWFANVGDVIHNLSAFQSDGLVLHHGYMMETSTVDRTYVMRGVSLKGQPTFNLTQSFSSVVKRRVTATPYGFGFNLGALSGRQVAILAALGLSRRR